MSEAHELHIKIPKRTLQGAFATFMAAGLLVAMDVPLQSAAVIAGVLGLLYELSRVVTGRPIRESAICLAAQVGAVLTFVWAYLHLAPQG
jgi:hypothetical protein